LKHINEFSGKKQYYQQNSAKHFYETGKVINNHVDQKAETWFVAQITWQWNSYL